MTDRSALSKGYVVKVRPNRLRDDSDCVCILKKLTLLKIHVGRQAGRQDSALGRQDFALGRQDSALGRHVIGNVARTNSNV